MKYLFLVCVMCIVGCTEYKHVKAEGTKITINGKECELFLIETPGENLRFIDCGPGSSATTIGAKNPTCIGQYVPPVAPVQDASVAPPALLPTLDPDTTCVCKKNK